MKAIILSRVSTESQDLRQQTEEVLKFARNDGYEDKDIEIIEEKESGVKLSEEQRLGLIEMKQRILSHPGTYSCVYSYEISRIGRRAEVNYSIRNFLQQNGIQLVILKPYIRLFNEDFKIDESANMSFAIFNALAENEGYLRKERLARGKLNKQKAGYYVGGHLPWGYTTSPDNKIIIDEEKATMIRYIFDEYVNNDRSTYDIGNQLLTTGEFNTTTLGSSVSLVRQILRHTAYIGEQPLYRSSSQRRAMNIYPRIIDDDTFYAAQEKLSSKSSVKTKHKHIYYCKGLIKDPRNGRTLTPHYTSGNYSSSHVTQSQRQNLSIPINLIDSFAWHITKIFNESKREEKRTSLIDNIIKEVTTLEKQISNLEKILKSYEDKELKIQERIVSGKLNEDLGDKMISNLNIEKSQSQHSLKTYKVKHQMNLQRLRILTCNYGQIDEIDIFQLTDNQQIAKHIKNTIITIELTKNEDKNRKRREPTGHFIIHFIDNTSKLFYYNTYTHDIWDKDMQLIDYQYLKRVTSVASKKSKMRGL